MSKPYPSARSGDLSEFESWLQDETATEFAFVYAKAQSDERMRNGDSPPLLSREARKLAKLAYQAHMQGTVMLFQRRDEDAIAYLAVKRQTSLDPDTPPRRADEPAQIEPTSPRRAPIERVTGKKHLHQQRRRH